MRNEIIKNDSINEEELNLKCPLIINQYNNIFTPNIPFNQNDLIKIDDNKNLEAFNRWMIKKANQTEEFKKLFPLYNNIIYPDSLQFFNLSSFELLPIKLNKMENILFKQQLGNINEYKEIKHTNYIMRFNNKKLYDESNLLNTININDGRHLYFLTDNIFEELNNPNCFIKISVEPFDSVKIIQFLDLFYLKIEFNNLVKEYSRYVLKEFCSESLEISSNHNSLICCFSLSTFKQREFLHDHFINCNIFNSIISNKTTNSFLGINGIELIKNNEKKENIMYDFSRLNNGIYVWNNGKIYKIGNNGENFNFKGLQLV